jgi:hypothetical protein
MPPDLDPSEHGIRSFGIWTGKFRRCPRLFRLSNPAFHRCIGDGRSRAALAAKPALDGLEPHAAGVFFSSPSFPLHRVRNQKRRSASSCTRLARASPFGHQPRLAAYDKACHTARPFVIIAKQIRVAPEAPQKTLIVHRSHSRRPQRRRPVELQRGRASPGSIVEHHLRDADHP